MKKILLANKFQLNNALLNHLLVQTVPDYYFAASTNDLNFFRTALYERGFEFVRFSPQRLQLGVDLVEINGMKALFVKQQTKRAPSLARLVDFAKKYYAEIVFTQSDQVIFRQQNGIIIAGTSLLKVNSLGQEFAIVVSTENGDLHQTSLLRNVRLANGNYRTIVVQTLFGTKIRRRVHRYAEDKNFVVNVEKTITSSFTSSPKSTNRIQTGRGLEYGQEEILKEAKFDHKQATELGKKLVINQLHKRETEYTNDPNLAYQPFEKMPEDMQYRQNDKTFQQPLRRKLGYFGYLQPVLEDKYVDVRLKSKHHSRMANYGVEDYLNLVEKERLDASFKEYEAQQQVEVEPELNEEDDSNYSEVIRLQPIHESESEQSEQLNKQEDLNQDYTTDIPWEQSGENDAEIVVSDYVEEAPKSDSTTEQAESTDYSSAMPHSQDEIDQDQEVANKMAREGYSKPDENLSGVKSISKFGNWFRLWKNKLSLKKVAKPSDENQVDLDAYNKSLEKKEDVEVENVISSDFVDDEAQNEVDSDFEDSADHATQTIDQSYLEEEQFKLSEEQRSERMRVLFDLNAEFERCEKVLNQFNYLSKSPNNFLDKLNEWKVIADEHFTNVSLEDQLRNDDEVSNERLEDLVRHLRMLSDDFQQKNQRILNLQKRINLQNYIANKEKTLEDSLKQAAPVVASFNEKNKDILEKIELRISRLTKEIEVS